MRWPFMLRRTHENAVNDLKRELDAEYRHWRTEAERAKLALGDALRRNRVWEGDYQRLAEALPLPKFEVMAREDQDLTSPATILSVRWDVSPLARYTRIPVFLPMSAPDHQLAREYRRAFVVDVMRRLWADTAKSMNKALGREVFPTDAYIEDVE